MTKDIISFIIHSDMKEDWKIRSIYEMCNKQYKEYIRFGEIPEEEKSKRGNGVNGDGYKNIGYEEGVSVWDCVYNFDTGKYHLVAPHGNSCTHGDFTQSAFPDDCCGCNPKQKIYVVTGIEVGYGADKEPLLKDVKIVKELPYDYFAFEE